MIVQLVCVARVRYPEELEGTGGLGHRVAEHVADLRRGHVARRARREPVQHRLGQVHRHEPEAQAAGRHLHRTKHTYYCTRTYTFTE